MSLKSIIQDGEGSGRITGVTLNNSLKVTQVPLTASDYNAIGYSKIFKDKIYVEQFKNSSGSTAMNVDGSVNNVEFTVNSTTNLVKVITYIKFILNDEQLSISSSEGSRFGSAAPAPGLTNGIEFYFYGSTIEPLFVTPIKQAIEFYYYCTQVENFVGGLGAGEDVVIATYNLPAPIVLSPVTNDKLVVKIRDDLTSVNVFRAQVFGTQEFL